MVGKIGTNTAVANNEQIIQGIAQGVANANTQQDVLLREQNELLRQILAKTGVYLDGKTLARSVEKTKRERGVNIMSGGVIVGISKHRRLRFPRSVHLLWYNGNPC